jgi:uncharacterized protein
MLNADERRAIQGLFDRLNEAERTSPPRERDAEELIADNMQRQPAAPYYMAQTIIMQTYALEEAERQINALKAELDRRPARGGGLLGGLFGNDDRNSSRGGYQSQQPAYNQQGRGPWNQGNAGAGGPWNQGGYGGGGGGFLAGAAQTALGVAGGVMLGSAIAGMVGGAFADEPAADQPQDEGADQGVEDNGTEDLGGGEDFGGGDFGDGGDF